MARAPRWRKSVARKPRVPVIHFSKLLKLHNLFEHSGSATKSFDEIKIFDRSAARVEGQHAFGNSMQSQTLLRMQSRFGQDMNYNPQQWYLARPKGEATGWNPGNVYCGKPIRRSRSV